MKTILLIALAALATLHADPPPVTRPPATKSKLPAPTIADAAYGTHPKQLLHFWKATTEKPAPLLFFIHGGGWVNGNRDSVGPLLPEMLAAGISVVSIEYRFIADATAEKIEPPVKAPLHDAARALQFVRSKAAEWNIDPTRVAASGGSAGACSSLWLAFHDDLAAPASDDPIARQSTRIIFAAVAGAQTTLDPAQMHEWTPNSTYGGHAFGFSKPADPASRDTQFSLFLAERERVLPWIREFSPYEHVSAGDPPVWLIYNNAPALGQPAKDPTHTANFGIKLQEHCKKNGVPCEFVYPGAPDVKHPTQAEALIAVLIKGEKP